MLVEWRELGRWASDGVWVEGEGTGDWFWGSGGCSWRRAAEK